MSSAIAEIRPSASVLTPKITYEDFLERYDGIHAEWVDGEVLSNRANVIEHSALR